MSCRFRRPSITATFVLLLVSSASAFAQLTLRVVATGLTQPVQFVQDPVRDGVHYVVQQNGVVRVLVDGALQPTPFLDLSGAIAASGEQGLLGLAFSPDYATSRRFFVNFTNPDGHTVIARFRHRDDDPLQTDMSTRFDLRWPGGQPFIVQPYSNHNGGKILFGSDGFLYVGMGDGGSGNDPQHHAQNPSSLLGKMLRIDVSVSDADPDGYRIPSTNPFVNGAGPVAALGEIWAFGLRNPWRFSQDLPSLGGTGALVIGDVGQGAREEIDYEPPGAGGRNYGWRNYEGTLPNVGSLPPAYTPLRAPLFDYGRSEGRSITGGVVYRGTRLGSNFRGRYFYADFITRRLWSLGLVIDTGSGEAGMTDRAEHTAELGGTTAIGNVASIDIDVHGEMYLSDWSGGRIVRVESAEPDTDEDGLPDPWEADLGLDPASASGADGASGDPDGDGRSNADEYAAGTHPNGLRRYHLAEGAVSRFFNLTCAVANPNPQPARVLVAFNRFDGRRVIHRLVVPARGHARFESGSDPQLNGTSFGVEVESDVEVAVDRTMRWDASGGEYGAHAETATAGLSPSWYFAEGATHSGFNLFYLLTNPNAVAADVTVTYLRPAPESPVVKTYQVPAASRFTVWVNQEDSVLAATDVAAVVTTSPATPIVAERAMYRDGGGRLFDAGHGALGATAPSLRWYLAEGATGDFFDLFVLIANPEPGVADVLVRWLLPSGEVIPQQYRVDGHSRLTLWADALDTRLSDAGVSVVVESQNGVPIVVERAMWWPGPTAATWNEAHASVGVVDPAARWVAAAGESGGARGAATYLLVANTGLSPVEVDVSVLFEGRPALTRAISLGPTSRSGFDALDLFPEVAGEKYGLLVEARDPTAPLIVERSTYWNAAGRFWGAGVNAVALPLR